MNGIFCLVTRHNTARINLIVCNVCPPAPLYLDLNTSYGVLYLGLIVVCEPDLYTLTLMLYLISVYTASRSRTELMQCTNLTSRVV